MDESIKYILKNAGKDPKEIKFLEEMEVLILNSKNISYVARDLIRLLKEEFEKDRYQIEKYYSVYVSVGEEYPYKSYDELFTPTELIKKYNATHADKIYVYNRTHIFNTTALVDYLIQYGIDARASSGGVSVSISADKFRELVREANEENNGYKKR